MTSPQPALLQSMLDDGETAVLDWDRRNIAANETDADREQERQFWSRAGVVPLAARLGEFVQHEAREDGLSVFSSTWWHLRAQDWCSCEVHIALLLLGLDMHSSAFDVSDCDDLPRTFHGTTYKSLSNILHAGGLRAGPNGHTFKGRHYKGVFQCADLGEAFQRSDPRQGMDEVGVVHPCAMPCVLELRVSDLRRFHKTRKDLFVTPGAAGQLLRIIRIARVHFNLRYVQNFKKLNTPQTVATMDKLCGCGSPSFGTCGLLIPDRWWEHGWQKSNKGYIYCPTCANRVIFHSRLIQ